MKTRSLLILAAIAALAAAAPNFYLGAWKITSAVVAPWANPELKQDPAEVGSLLGKTISVQPAGITGPRALACRGPHYRIRDYPADMLFQGAFGEMHSRNPSADPQKIAAQLGFEGKSWKTLETGCANELELHFLNPTTAAFGLNNTVYILKKQ